MSIVLNLEFATLEEALPVLRKLTEAMPSDKLPEITALFNAPSPAEQALNKAVEVKKTTRKKTPEAVTEPTEVETDISDIDDIEIITNDEGEAVTIDTLLAKAQKLVKASKENGPKIVALLEKAKVKKIPDLKKEHYKVLDQQLDKLASIKKK